LGRKKTNQEDLPMPRLTKLKWVKTAGVRKKNDGV